jgi:hypothetical protein
MGLVTGVGCLGGFFGPLLVGYFNNHTGGFAYDFGLIAVDLLIGSGLSFLLDRAPAEVRQSGWRPSPALSVESPAGMTTAPDNRGPREKPFYGVTEVCRNYTLVDRTTMDAFPQAG